MCVFNQKAISKQVNGLQENCDGDVKEATHLLEMNIKLKIC